MSGKVNEGGRDSREEEGVRRRDEVGEEEGRKQAKVKSRAKERERERE